MYGNTCLRHIPHSLKSEHMCSRLQPHQTHLNLNPNTTLYLNLSFSYIVLDALLRLQLHSTRRSTSASASQYSMLYLGFSFTVLDALPRLQLHSTRCSTSASASQYSMLYLCFSFTVLNPLPLLQLHSTRFLTLLGAADPELCVG